MDIAESFTSITFTIGVGFFGGILIGYALRKVVRLAAIVSGLFLAGLAYLQYQQIASINWDKLERVSEGVVRTFANAITLIDADNIGVAEFAIINGIPMGDKMTLWVTRITDKSQTI
jgi:uncharacterized membrane protein (Fun14 family)